MSKRIIMLMVVVFAVLFFVHKSSGAEPVGNSLTINFDEPNDVKALSKDGNLKFTAEKKVAGAGAAEIECLFDGNGFHFPMPLNATQGVASFWIFDNLNAVDPYFSSGITFICQKDVDKKRETSTFSLNMGRDGGDWVYITPVIGAKEQGRNTYVKRRPGWTRIDVINPKGEGNKAFLVYINGVLAFQTVEKYISLKGISFSSGWGQGRMYVDELSYNPDPDAFKPNAVQEIIIGDEAENLKVSGANNIAFKVRLDPKGAYSGDGEITVKLFDGAEEELASKKIKVIWDKQDGNVVSEVFEKLPHSGRYWITADYKDAGTVYPMLVCKKVNVQFYGADSQSGKNDSIVLGKLWNWLPFGDKATSTQAIPTPEKAPDTVPSDWSGAVKIKDVFYDSTEFAYQAGWYQRKAEVPADWKGRKIKINIEDPLTIATVYIDAKKLGDIEWPGGSLDITERVKPGKEFDLTIFVRAEYNVGYEKFVKNPWGGQIRIRGLRGPVSFVSEPLKGPKIDFTAINTFINPKRIELEISCKDLKEGRQYTVGGAVSAAGETVLKIPEKTFTAKGPVEKIKITTEWGNPVFWDIFKPFLYDFTAKLSEGKELVDVAAPERFGFRDITFDGRYVILNGRKITFSQGGMTTLFSNFGRVAYMKEYNLNFLCSEHLQHMSSPGSSGTTSPDEFVDFSDNSGIPSYMQVFTAFRLKILTDLNRDKDPAFWSYLDKMLDYTFRKFRNSPGVFFYSGPHAIDMGSLYNPYLQDGLWQRDPSESNVGLRYYNTQKRLMDTIRKADPSRKIVGQDSGNFCDVCGITQYAGFTTIQELIEMNSYWVENGKKPLFFTEVAAPFQFNWTNRSRVGGHHAKKIIVYDAEWCAITKGDDAFVRTGLDNKVLDRYERLSKGRYENIYKIKDPAAQKKALADYSNTTGPEFPTNMYDYYPDTLRNQVWFDRLFEQVLNWRSDGAGLTDRFYITQAFPGQFGDKFKQLYNQVTAFISGPTEDRYDKTHIVAPYETLRRGVTVLNNSDKSQKLKVAWKLELDGKKVAEKNDSVEIPAGEKTIVPVNAYISANKDCAGTFSMELFGEDGKKLCDDSVSINVIVPKNYRTEKRIALIDPEGDTAKVLKNAGVEFQRIPFTMELDKFDIIIFGRRAFLYEFDNTKDGYDLDALTKAGKTVIVMEQDEKTLRNRFNLRAEYISTRNVYGREFRGALLDGLPNGCLNFWRGSATLTDGYEIARAQLTPRSQQGNGGSWFYLWHDGTEHTRPMKWGNHHNVATVVIIKPDTGSFRTLLDCEFALNYAAAWELENENGKVIFSQIDVSGRSEAGPEVTRYLQNLASYASAPDKTDWKDAVYIGGVKGEKLLTKLFVPFKKINSPTEAAAGKNVLVLGEAEPGDLEKMKAPLSAFVKAGGTVFSLPKDDAQMAALPVPEKITLKEQPVNSIVIGANKDSLLAGLGNSDFYWKGNVPVKTIEKVKGASLQLDPGVLARIPQDDGEWVLCQFDPSMFANEDYFWLKDSERYTERALRTMLTNLNVRMNVPQFMQAPKAQKEIFKTVNLAGEWWMHKGEAKIFIPPEKEPYGGPGSKWKKIELPANYREKLPEMAEKAGSLYYNRTFELPELPAGANGIFQIAAVRGLDFVKLNKVQIGSTTPDENPNELSTITRTYNIPKGLLTKGNNHIQIFTHYDTGALLSPGDGNISFPVTLTIYSDNAKVAALPALNLAGTWRGIALKEGEKDMPDAQAKGWHDVKVPGEYNPQNAEWGSHLGYFWYERKFTIADKLPEGAAPYIHMGWVDDEDETYINGKLVGAINKATNPKNYYNAERLYPIPPELLKVGENTIRVRCNNTNSTGSIAAPAEILFEHPKVTLDRQLKVSPYLYNIDKTDDPYVFQGW